MIRLQKIIFPERFDETVELYFRGSHEVSFRDDLRPEFKKQPCSFDTYFNMFSLESWKRYTCLENVALSLITKGTCRVRLYGLNRYNVATLLTEHEISHDSMTETVLPFPATDSQMVYWTLEPGQDFAFDQAWYCTDMAAENSSRVLVDAIICTFRREIHVRRNLGILANFFKKYPDFGESLRVMIVDNGQTLTAGDMPEGSFSLYPNNNTGGSGGFARGMLEALERSDGPVASHVLLMDDDILLHPESLLTTISFLRLLRHEYEDAFLGGAMLDLEDKVMQFESQAAWNQKKLVWMNHKRDLDVRLRSACVYNDFPIPVPRENAYQAWWYCVIPMQMLQKHGLPYPFFVRQDDIEYALRATPSSIIHLNGICVWHDPFYKKDPLLISYLLARNTAVAHSLNANHSRLALLAFFLRLFAKSALIFNYKATENICDGINDYLKGPDFLKAPATCARVLQEQGTRVEKSLPVSELPQDFPPLRQEKDLKRRLSLLQTIVCILTLNGHLLPTALRKPEGMCTHYQLTVGNFYLRRSVLLINPFNNTFVRRTASFRQLWRCGWRFVRLCCRVARNYGKVSAAYSAAHAEMTSPDFWKHYLGLTGSKTARNKHDDA